jgi:hypothetical protein
MFAARTVSWLHFRLSPPRRDQLQFAAVPRQPQPHAFRGVKGRPAASRVTQSSPELTSASANIEQIAYCRNVPANERRDSSHIVRRINRSSVKLDRIESRAIFAH